MQAQRSVVLDAKQSPIGPRQILSSVVFSEEWVGPGRDDKGQVPSEFIQDLLERAKGYLRTLELEFLVPKRKTRRAQNALLELVSNTFRHSIDPFKCKLAIALCEPQLILILIENSAKAADAQLFQGRILECYKAWAQGDESVKQMRDYLQSLPQSGLGVWYLITQLDCDLIMEYDSEADNLQVTCYVN